ncbi:kinase-like protein [Hypoxylon sp. FL1150]|nr:kinase-like protein [Hypoxylon sp. FL1150]
MEKAATKLIVGDLFGAAPNAPKWDTEPSVSAIEAVSRQHLNSASCKVKFLAAGIFNRAYTATLKDGRRFIMRLSLPIAPRDKTRSEVSALRIVRSATTVPVPEVVAFDDSSKNEIGYEWILMGLMPGKPLYYHWRKMSMIQKLALVEQMADYQSQLFRYEDALRGIGPLVLPSEPRSSVSKLPAGDYHVRYRDSHEWIRGHLDNIIEAQETVISKSESEEDREDAMEDLEFTRQLEEIMPILFPPNNDESHPCERTILWHGDLSLHNILAGSNGEITAIIDWETASMMPLWVAGQPPKFLDGSVREVQPDRDTYGTKADLDEEGGDGGTNELDDEGMSDLYWEHLMEYEQTQLRKVYAARMRLLWPEWDATQQDGLKVDFFDASVCIARGWTFKHILDWITAIKGGSQVRLAEIVNTPHNRTSKN